MTIPEIKAANRLEDAVGRAGAKLVRYGGRLVTNRCALLMHKPGHNCVTVDVEKQLWHCNDCDCGGDVIRWLALLQGITDAQVIKSLGGNDNGAPTAKPATAPADLKFETVATYDYTDAVGELVFQVVRQHAADPSKPAGYVKTFRQRRPDEHGGWLYNMDGVERVLYRLPEVAAAKTVWIVEGEKDADTLAKLGFTATCNVGGAGKWLAAYSESLEKKQVAICGDNDDVGQKHVKMVFDALVGKAKGVRLVKVPTEYKDVTDYVGSFKDETTAKRALFGLLDSATPFVRGISLPIFRISELEERYARHVANLGVNCLDLSKWLPSLVKVRPLVPGEVALLLGATGIGKTAALSNIAVRAWPMPTLFFEIELPDDLMFERVIALDRKLSCIQVEKGYKTGERFGEAAIDRRLSHFYLCTISQLNSAEIERLITRSELKIGERPKLVLIDYIGLVHGSGKSRYERISGVAEELKVIAKRTQTIIIMASQVSRSEESEIALTSGKDSGSLENSSGLVIGLWRDAKDATLMNLKVLKSTKGGAGTRFECNYNLDTLAITERSQIADADVPTRYTDV